MLDVDLLAKIKAVIPMPLGQVDAISEDKGEPRFALRRSNSDYTLFLDGTAMGGMVTFECEIAGLNVDTVETAADTLRRGLNGFRGTQGSTTFLGTWVSDQDGNYQFKYFDADEWFSLAALRIEVLTTG
jgi:hypothetical protein